MSNAEFKQIKVLNSILLKEVTESKDRIEELEEENQELIISSARYIKYSQWLNYNHSIPHVPVYPILNDRLVYHKNWLTNKYRLS